MIFTTEFTTGDAEPYTNIAYACRQKYMDYAKPRFSVKVEPADDGFDVIVGTDVFARGVFLSIDGIDNFFSDNYFDILPGCERKIRVNTSISRDEFVKQLKINSIGSTV